MEISATTDDEGPGPFGTPDGMHASFDRASDEYVDIPARFGAVGTPASDARVRVVAGPLGSGKSLLLRRLRDYQTHQPEGESFATDVQPAQALTTDDLRDFQQRTKSVSGNTETWSSLWRRAIVMSVATLMIFDRRLSSKLDDELVAEMKRHPHLARCRAPRGVAQCAHELIFEAGGGHAIVRLLGDTTWDDLEHYIGQALSSLPPIYVYVDGIDDNFKWAPNLWLSCQRGLFYSVMGLLREETLRGRLHIVIAVRDIVMATVRQSEHAGRYLNAAHIKELRWDRESMYHLLHGKVGHLPERHLADAGRTGVGRWLGMEHITNSSRGVSERIEDYLIRHTRLVPRDLIRLGNVLCARRGAAGRTLSVEEVKSAVHDCAYDFAQSELDQCVNQMLSDIAPVAASEFLDTATVLDNYHLGDNRDLMVSVLSIAETEAFGEERLAEINRTARDAFARYTDHPERIRLGDILWQHRLLGVVDRGSRGVGDFFDPSGNGRVTNPALPTQPGATYVFHPIVLDTVSLQVTEESPVWPR